MGIGIEKNFKINKYPKYTDEEHELISQKTFENWFYVNQRMAKALYYSKHGMNCGDISKNASIEGTMSRTLKNGEKSNILRHSHISWYMTALGKQFYYYVHILKLEWDWKKIEN